MSRRSLLTVVPVALVAACSTGSTPPPAGAQISVRFGAPQALLDDVDEIALYVVSAAKTGATCDSATGLVQAPSGTTGLVANDIADQAGVIRVPMARTTPNGDPCPNGGVFCSDEITLPRDPQDALIFQPVGAKQGAALAVGCTTAAVNSDPFYVEVSILRYVEPAVCGDGVLQMGEQCEGNGGPPGDADPVCDTTCRTKEILLSSDHLGPSSIKITNEPADSKSGVSLVWSKADNATNANPVHAVFQDTNFGTTGTGPEVNYRQMSQHLAPIASPALLGSQIRLPLAGGSIPGFDQRPRAQTAPAIATMTDGSVVVAYEDDRLSSTGELNISLTAISVDMALPHADEVYINTQGVDACSSPAVSGGPIDRALVTWTDNAGRRIRGRFWSVNGWLSTSDRTFSAADGNQPAVSGWNDGWIVVWHGRSSDDIDDILMATVSATGTIGAPTVVNDDRFGVQDQPKIAALPNGEFAIVWHASGQIMVQRFDTLGSPIPGDQSEPANVGAAAGASPAIAASSLADGFYALAWQSASGDIEGRLLDHVGGYLFNAVDGQSGPFRVSRDDVGARSRPAIAIGGAGHIVFAWQDHAADHFGIYARRFPLPVR